MNLKLSITLVLIIAFGCSQQSKDNENMQGQKADTMQSNTSETAGSTRKSQDSLENSQLTDSPQTANPFAFKSYFLTSDYNLDNCNALARCDCCTSEIYFKNDSIFVYSSTCEGTVNFTKGKYQFTNKALTLMHDSLLVYDRQPFGDGVSGEFGVFQERKYIKPSNFLIESCGGKILIHWAGNNYDEFGTEESKRVTLPVLINDPNSEITQKLELN